VRQEPFETLGLCHGALGGERDNGVAEEATDFREVFVAWDPLEVQVWVPVLQIECGQSKAMWTM
jgi:hypothetical protein